MKKEKIIASALEAQQLRCLGLKLGGFGDTLRGSQKKKKMEKAMD